MRFWQSLFLSEAEQLFDLAKMAEELGFDGVMISDHVLYFEQMQLRYPYSQDGKPPFFTGQTVWPECWSTIAGLAGFASSPTFTSCHCETQSSWRRSPRAWPGSAKAASFWARERGG